MPDSVKNWFGNNWLQIIILVAVVLMSLGATKSVVQSNTDDIAEVKADQSELRSQVLNELRRLNNRIDRMMERL